MHTISASNAQAAATHPDWLIKPEDANALNPKIWPRTAERIDGMLSIGGVSVSEAVAESGSPVYLIDEEDFRARASSFKEAFHGWDVFYAGKAFLSKTIARWVKEESLNLDVCSMGEIETALRADFDPAKIGFHGNNKSIDEIRFALENGIGRIIVDSFYEISRTEQIAQQLGITANVMVRVTAGVSAHTHDYIATAHEDQKFGFSIASGQALVAMIRCHNSAQLNLLGVHSHIGSQIFDSSGFEVAAKRTLKMLAQFADATSTQLPELDLGGGFGIAYTDEDEPATPRSLASDLQGIVKKQAEILSLDLPRVSIEPGRSIVGPTGVAVYEVGTVKVVDLEEGSRVYVSVDGGMSDNIRPALYGAEYTAVLASRASDCEPVLCRVVGKHCEGGDIVVHDVYLPGDIVPGDLIAVPACGAYSYAMASNYNHIPRPPVVSVKAGRLQTMIRRETLADLARLDVGE